MLFYFVLFYLLANISASSLVKPNIIAIVADDLGWNDVGFHGQTQIPTPNIDAIAYSGVSFSRHYTLPVCSPSRASFLTGYHSLRTGIPGPLYPDERTALPLNFKLLPEYLKELGYKTHLVGKWHLGHFQTPYMPTMRGFDDHLGYLLGYIHLFTHEVTWKNQTGFDFRKNLSLAREYTGQYATQIFTDESIKIINEHDSSEPFFMEIGHVATHYPLEVRSIEENDDKFGYIKDSNRRLYAGILSELDNSIGKVIEALSIKGILNNTIILFFSDNGGSTQTGYLDNYGSNWPLRGQKFTLFEGGVRCAAALWAPNLKKPGRIYDSLVHISDWLPTLYSAAGGDVKQLGPIDGINQWEAIRKGKKGPRKETILHVDKFLQQAAYLKKEWKLIIGNNTGLFDGHFGTIGRSDPLNTTAVVTSLTALSLVSAGAKCLNEEDIVRLSNRENIECEKFEPKENETTMLFNVFEDPCENKNLANKYPHRVKNLLKDIEQWKEKTAPLQSEKQDPGSFPSVNGGVWGPWLD